MASQGKPAAATARDPPSRTLGRDLVYGTQRLPEADPGARLYAAQRLYALCEGLRSQEQGRPQVQVRYPLGSGEGRLCGSFWLDLTVRLLGWKRAVSCIFWTLAADRPYLLAALGRPTGRTGRPRSVASSATVGERGSGPCWC